MVKCPRCRKSINFLLRKEVKVVTTLCSQDHEHWARDEALASTLNGFFCPSCEDKVCATEEDAKKILKEKK